MQSNPASRSGIKGHFNIPPAVEDPHHLHSVFNGSVKDDVVFKDQATQPRGQLFTRTTQVGTGSEALLAGLEDAINKTVCVLRTMPGDILPNFGKISLC